MWPFDTYHYLFDTYHLLHCPKECNPARNTAQLCTSEQHLLAPHQRAAHHYLLGPLEPNISPQVISIRSVWMDALIDLIDIWLSTEMQLFLSCFTVWHGETFSKDENHDIHVNHWRYVSVYVSHYTCTARISANIVLALPESVQILSCTARISANLNLHWQNQCNPHIVTMVKFHFSVCESL